MTYYIDTMGCQMNERDSETIAGVLEELGFAPTEDWHDARVIVLNTCSVREKPHHKVFSRLGAMEKLKRERPDTIVAVCGCMAQAIPDDIRARAPFVDIILGPKNVGDLREAVLSAAEAKTVVTDTAATVPEGLPARRKSAISAYVNIAYGCNNFCAYCIVPYARGREQSRLPDDILGEVRGLAAAVAVQDLGLQPQVLNLPTPAPTSVGEPDACPAESSPTEVGAGLMGQVPGTEVPGLEEASRSSRPAVQDLGLQPQVLNLSVPAPTSVGEPDACPAESSPTEVGAGLMGQVPGTEVPGLERRSGGIREITLLGQNVNSYGKDLSVAVDFADLLGMMNEIGGLERIRFTTSHPKDLSDKLIQAMARLEKVCEHLHLPIQSGDNEVLQRMNRRYTIEHYLDLIRRMRAAAPEVAITTDVIVGFPGETEEQFQRTLDAFAEIRFDQAFMFKYNDRPGTAAASFPDKIDEGTKQERLLRLVKLQNEIAREVNRAQEGQVFEVMVEGPDPKRADHLRGRTRQNKLMIFAGVGIPPGTLVQVRAEKGFLWGYTGQSDGDR
jgi:tRNA A37 methylthiotransferase MiaB